MEITRLTRRGRLRFTIMAAVLAMAGLLIPASQIALAGTAARSAAGSAPKPSIVLVHGAWADSSTGTPLSAGSSTTGTPSTCRPTRCWASDMTPSSSATS